MKVVKEVFKQILEQLESEISGKPTPYEFDHGIKKAIKIVRAAEQEYYGGWIPCKSGKLPKECEDVEVTIEEVANDVGGKRLYTTRSWLQDGHWVIKKNPYHPTVIAWKYPAEPYKESEVE